MAKTSMVEREKRRAGIVKKYAAKRAKLKELIRSPKTTPEQRVAAQVELQMPAPRGSATAVPSPGALGACTASSAWRG
jgi:small subunit ribosomal protein S14